MGPLRGRGRGKEMERGGAKAGRSSPPEQHQDSCHTSTGSTFRPCRPFLKAEDFPSPLVQSRHLAMPSTQALSWLPTSSSTLQDPVQNGLRAGGTPHTDDEIISVDADNIMPVLQHFTPTHDQSQVPTKHDDPVPRYKGAIEVQQVANLLESNHEPLNDDRPEKNTTKAVHVVSACSSGSESINLTELARQFAQKDENRRQRYQSPIKVQQITTLPSKEDRPGSSATNRVHSDALSLSKSESMNFTECAERMQVDSEDDPDEVESAVDPSLVYMYKVKIEFAPTLRAIFEKYGDITSASDVKSPEMLSFCLERLCEICQKLERTKFSDLKPKELDKMLIEVHDFERVKLTVGWLLEKLKDISETIVSFEGYKSMKAEKIKYDASIVELKKELASVKRKMAEKIKAEKIKADVCKCMVRNVQARVKSLEKKGLADGLL